MRTLSASLITGYIFFYFSELAFWARPKPEDNLLNWLETWLAYSVMAFLFLVVIQKYRVRSLPALFLAGAFFGWLGEGIVVQTAYDSLPLSISFTGLAWHGLITVLAGWYGLQLALRKSMKKALIYSLLIGVFIWLWGVSWFYEEPTTIVEPATFGVYIFVSTILLGISIFISSRVFIVPVTYPKWTIWIVAAIFIILYGLILISGNYLALILIPLLAILHFTLTKNSQTETNENILVFLSDPVPWMRYVALLLIPASAALLYTFYYHSGFKLPTNWLVYLIITPTGFAAFGWSVWKIWRKPKLKNEPVDE